MTSRTETVHTKLGTRQMLSRVPEITVYFWIVKVLCTTVGESAADYVNETMGLGLAWTTAVMTALLALVLMVQFRQRRYVPGVYWLTVVLISVVGTLATDNLSDGLGVSLLVTAPAAAALLIAVFIVWYRAERTLSIHSIVTARREAYYWLVVLVTFALGTAMGDLLVDRLSMSLLGAVVVFAGALCAVVVLWRTALLGTLTAFWVGYVLTRPLGGSTGDYLSGNRADGGAGLGTLGTSLFFLLSITAIVVYLTVSGRDRARPADEDPAVAA